MRIGIFGGSFDPIHNAHLALARAALESLQLDEIIFVPAHRNPLKGRSGASAKHRLEMVRLAIQGEPKFSYSDIEIHRRGPSYTIDTLSELEYVRPAEYWILIGSDALKDIESWKSPDKVLKTARLGVALRAKQRHEDLLPVVEDEVLKRVDWIPMPQSDISSTEVKNALEIGKSTSLWIPQAVSDYINQHKLYRNA